MSARELSRLATVKAMLATVETPELLQLIYWRAKRCYERSGASAQNSILTSPLCAQQCIRGIPSAGRRIATCLDAFARSPERLPSILRDPLRRSFAIRRQSLYGRLNHCPVVLRLGHLRTGRFAIEPGRPRKVPGNSNAMLVHVTEIIEGHRISVLRRCAVPSQRFRKVLRPPNPVLVHPRQLHLRV